MIEMLETRMPKSFGRARNADEIADMASRGEDVSGYFTNKFTVVKPPRHMCVDPPRGEVAQTEAEIDES